jgi:hypothetical protein
MANHPYNQHREQQVAHRRVATILKDHPSGASKHMKGPAYSQITSKSAAVRDDDIRGPGSKSSRFARGGKVKGDTNITIVVPGGSAKPPMPPVGAAPPMPIPPPPAPPPGMPMRAAGGRVGKAGGGALNFAQIKKSAARAKANSFMRGGAATGVGREEKAAKMRGK